MGLSSALHQLSKQMTVEFAAAAAAAAAFKFANVAKRYRKIHGAMTWIFSSIGEGQDGSVWLLPDVVLSLVV